MDEDSRDTREGRLGCFCERVHSLASGERAPAGEADRGQLLALQYVQHGVLRECKAGARISGH